MTLPLTPSPSQTIGPLYGFALMFPSCENGVDPAAPEAVIVHGSVFDGKGEALAYPEAMLELWSDGFFARTRTDENGEYRAVVRKPKAPSASEAPFINVSVFARGLLKQVRTRLYFPDESDRNSSDELLVLVGDRQSTLVAEADASGLRFDVRLQGRDETVFLEV